MRKQHSSQRGDTAATLQRQWKAGGQQTSPHPPTSHAWLASRTPHTASRQRRTATVTMTASGHEKRREGSLDRYRSQRPPGEQAEVAAVNDSSNHRNRSRQRGIGGAASGQKKPPPATLKPLERTLWECEWSVDRQRSHSNRTKPTSKQDDPHTQRLYRWPRTESEATAWATRPHTKANRPRAGSNTLLASQA